MSLQTRRADAGRASRNRFDGRFGRRHQRSRHSGNCRRGHRMRNDGGQNAIQKRNSRRQIERFAPRNRTRDSRRIQRAQRNRRHGGALERLGNFCENLHAGVQDRKVKAMRQMGSLGGGNHFIEVCLDTESNVWLMLHSGSRNIGKELAERHIATAKTLHRLNELPDPNLAYFIQGTEEFKNYWSDLDWAQSYALMNREVMMKRLLKSFNRMFNKQKAFRPEIAVNCHHNYVALEEHYGEKVFVTRKGAINAESGRFGIIPGSMGAKSFIIQGLGNPESYNSCSHGAGRKMSRTAAKKRFSREDLERQTKGVECRKDSGVIDEIPGAYKNIDEVMRNQSDLVEIVAELKQVVCVKG